MARAKSSSWTLRPAREEDWPAAIALNQADLPHLSSLTLETFEELVTRSLQVWVADSNGRVAGFALVMDQRAEYESLNFQWFKARYADFVYVDRVVVDEQSRRLGIASAFYLQIETLARARGSPFVTCEVNLRPPNPDSLAFHDRHGFVEVGTQDTDGGEKTVSLRVKRLA